MYFTPHQNENDCDSTHTHTAFYVLNYFLNRVKAHSLELAMGFSKQEYGSGLPFPSPWDLPDPGIEPRSPTLPADALTSEPPGKPLELATPL